MIIWSQHHGFLQADWPSYRTPPQTKYYSKFKDHLATKALPHILRDTIRGQRIDEQLRAHLVQSLTYWAKHGHGDVLLVCVEAGIVTPNSLCAILASVPESEMLWIGRHFHRAAFFLPGGLAAIIDFALANGHENAATRFTKLLEDRKAG
ncbi:hypothetical protein BC828DRAFT_437015 [Blastocladiella britannica]|nr:hypothetical protein BC828DRAFT_437015 [Blastocladiella britannica]